MTPSTAGERSNEDSNLTDIELGEKAIEIDAARKLPTLEIKQASDREPSSESNKRGCHLRWTRMVKTVEVNTSKSGLVRGSIASPGDAKDSLKNNVASTKTILDGVSGSAAPGEILALMGPSGSGKTSLLDVLSGRSKYDSGKITMDGMEVTGSVMKRLKRKIAYVKQADLFFGHLTVKDQLTYTALLRLPATMTKERKLTEVNRILKQLRLTKCANTPICQVSGGERKRVNIGTELLTDPLVVILDEPTSGLDSTSAVALIRMLHSLAHEGGKTIITSIHQPSSAVFRGFDKLMLLADGHTVYFGSPVASLSYLQAQGYECPDGYNAADHWMDLLVVDSAVDDEEEGEGEEDEDDFQADKSSGGRRTEKMDVHRRFSRASVKARQGVGGLTRRERKALAASNNTPRMKLIRAWDDEGLASQLDHEVLREDAETADTSASSHKDEAVLYHEDKYNTSWWTQFKVLIHRSMKNSRSEIFTPLNMVKSVLIGIVCGLLWFQLPYTEAAVFDRSSYYFFTMTYWVFDAMFNALMAFPSEREILLKERASGSYHLSAYFMAKTISEAPTRLALPSFYMIISYWMAGMNPSFAVFLGSTACTLLSVLAGESLGLFVGAIVFDMERSMVVMTVVSLALMVAGGFLVKNVPAFVGWVKYLSPFKYAYDASTQIVFNEPVPCDGSGVLEACAGGSTGYASTSDIFSFLGTQGSILFNVCLMFVVILLPRVGAYFALRSKKGAERS